MSIGRNDSPRFTSGSVSTSTILSPSATEQGFNSPHLKNLWLGLRAADRRTNLKEGDGCYIAPAGSIPCLRPDSLEKVSRRMGSVRAKSDRNAMALAALRIAVGLLFLIFGQYKVFGTEFTLGGGFQTWITRFLADGSYPFMAPLLRGFVLPHGTAIAFLVAYGELAIGLGLVLGLLVRPASAFGTIYMLALLFSSNYPGPHAAFWQYFGAALEHLVLALCFVAFALGETDQVLSLRSYLGRKSES
jgi:thiosulfate dehydrogenase (quinone) large subunit